jgi:hypothetical protein
MSLVKSKGEKPAKIPDRQNEALWYSFFFPYFIPSFVKMGFFLKLNKTPAKIDTCDNNCMQVSPDDGRVSVAGGPAGQGGGG